MSIKYQAFASLYLTIGKWKNPKPTNTDLEIRPLSDLSNVISDNYSTLGITLNGLPFEHMVYHFVLTYSNWETCNICFSESFESLSEGLQRILWKLGGVPQQRLTNLTILKYLPAGTRECWITIN